MSNPQLEPYCRIGGCPTGSAIQLAFPGGKLHRIGEGAGHDGSALAADIGQSVAFVQAGIFQEPIVAGVTAKRIFSQGLDRAALFAFAAGTVELEQAALSFTSRRGHDDGIGDHASQPPAAPLSVIEHVVVPETADAGNIGHMLVGPVTHELFFVKIVGGRQAGAPESLMLKKPVDPVH